MARKNRQTENAVLINDGKFCHIELTSVDGNPRKKERKIVENETGTTVENAQEFIVGTTEDAVKFVQAYNGNKTCLPHGGYAFYYNSHGPVNPQSPLAMTPQAKLKNTLVFLNAIIEDSAKDDLVGSNANNALDILESFIKTARKDIVKDIKAKGINAAVQFLKQNGIDVPAVSETPTELVEA